MTTGRMARPSSRAQRYPYRQFIKREGRFLAAIGLVLLVLGEGVLFLFGAAEHWLPEQHLGGAFGYALGTVAGWCSLAAVFWWRER